MALTISGLAKRGRAIITPIIVALNMSGLAKTGRAIVIPTLVALTIRVWPREGAPQDRACHSNSYHSDARIFGSGQDRGARFAKSVLFLYYCNLVVACALGFRV